MNKTAVVFIHGFTGGDKTWVNENNESFSELLGSYQELSELDFHEFTYHTKIVNIKNNVVSKVVAGIINTVLPAKFQVKTPIIKKNTPISEIAQELLTYIKFELYDYNNLIFVCHSMGGLIAKNAIVEVIENDIHIDQDIIGYCSLATPHKGAIPSILMSPFNIHAKEMQPLDKDNENLNDKWLDVSKRIDKTLYVRAKSDEIVSLTSSVPNSNGKKFPYEVVEADHTSICKPKAYNERICKILRKFLSDCQTKASVKNICMDDFEEESSSYDKETFVIKMLLAKVESLLIEDAKESFFLAEIIEKKATKADRETIKDLTYRIVSTYKTLAGSGTNKTSSELVSQVHEKIIDTDKQALDCAVKYINFMHKKGFLHQKANQNDLNVNWSKAVTLTDIEVHKETISD